MKPRPALILSLIVLFALVTNLSVRGEEDVWQPVSGPNGGSVAALAMSPNYAIDHIVFAGLRGQGVYCTTNYGTSWHSVSPRGWVVVDLAISPAFAEDQTLFVTSGLWTSGYSVHRSTDEGESWQDISPAWSALPDPPRLAISPDFASDGTLYVLGGAQTYLSTDRGDTFIELGGWFAVQHVADLAFSPNYATDQTLFALESSAGLYKSTDGGSSWALTGLQGILTTFAISPDYAVDQMLLAVLLEAGTGQLYLSYDGGTNWSPGTLTLEPAGQHTLLFSPSFSAADLVILAASSSDPGPYRSEDGGLTWSPVGWYDPLNPYSGGFIGGSVFALALAPGGIWDSAAFAGTSSGIYHSSNRGTHWYQANEGMPRLTIQTLAVAPDEPEIRLAGTRFFEHLRFDTSTAGEYDGNIQLSTDGGRTWRDVSGRLDQLQNVAFSPGFANDETAFAAAGTIGQHGYYDGGVYRSTDGGYNWEEVLGDQICQALAVSPEFVTDQTLWVSTATYASALGIQVSTDGGDNWVSLAPTITADVLVPSPNYAVDQVLFAGTQDRGLQRSADGGNTWTQVLTQPVTALAASPAYGASQTVYAGTKNGPTSAGEVYRSTDGGETWQRLETGIPPTWEGEPLTISLLSFAHDGSVLAGIFYGSEEGGGAVYRSTDGGDTWQAVGSGLDGYSVFALASVPSDSLTFNAGSDGGLWQLDVAQGGPAEPGTWESSGPRGGRAHALAVSPSFVDDGTAFSGEYMQHRYGNQSGLDIFKSSDGGQTWFSSATGTEEIPGASAVHEFAFSPQFTTDQTVFAATWGGLFKSTDRGETWQWVPRLFRGPPGAITAVAVAPDYPTSGHVLAGGGYGGVFVSRDDGVNWTADYSISGVNAIAYSPAFGTDNTAFVGSFGLFKTTDGGTGWTKVLTEGISALAISPEFGIDGTLFAGAGALYISDDGGTSWISVTLPTDPPIIHALAVSPDFAVDQTLFAGINSGLYRSGDGGLSWEPVVGFPALAVQSLALSPGWPGHPVLLAGTDHGVYRTADGGATWTLTPGMAALWTEAVAISADGSLLLADGVRHGFYGSRDRGGGWTPMGLNSMSGSSAVDIAISPAYGSDQTIFAAIRSLESIGGSVYRTTDDGANWEQVYGTGYVGSVAISPQFESDETVFATAEMRQVMRSEDGGDTWAAVGTWPPLISGAGIVALPTNYPADSTLFSGGPNGFWRLPPGETAWEPAATGLLSDTYVLSLAVSPYYATDHSLLAVASWSQALPGRYYYGVFRSSDGGVNWDLASVGMPDTVLRDVAFSPDYATDATAFAVGESQLFRSLDGGQSWTALGRPPGASSLYRVVADRLGAVYVSSDTGAWRYTTPAFDILIDGGFEADSGWELPETDRPAAYSDDVAYDGARSMRVGIDNSNNGSASYSSARQVVTIPSNAVNATLQCYIYSMSGEAVQLGQDQAFPENAVAASESASATAAGDAQYLLILDPESGDILETLFWQLSNDQSWQPRTFNLVAYAGQSIKIHFGVYNDASGGRTGMYVDNASLIVKGPGAAYHHYLPIVIRDP